MSKLVLSIWSSIIMLVFALFYFLKIIELDIVPNNNLNDNVIIFIQYFFFGMSIIYSTQNIWLLIRFFPDKHEKPSHYKSRIKKLCKEHSARFEDFQLSKANALICIVTVSSIYYFNSVYNWINALTLIWLVFILFPILIFYYQKLILLKKKK